MQFKKLKRGQDLLIYYIVRFGKLLQQLNRILYGISLWISPRIMIMWQWSFTCPNEKPVRQQTDDCCKNEELCRRLLVLSSWKRFLFWCRARYSVGSLKYATERWPDQIQLLVRGHCKGTVDPGQGLGGGFWEALRIVRSVILEKGT